MYYSLVHYFYHFSMLLRDPSKFSVALLSIVSGKTDAKLNDVCILFSLNHGVVGNANLFSL